MQALAAVTYLMFLAYVANFLMLSAVAARQAGRSVWLFGSGQPRQCLTGPAFVAAFAGAILWPPLRMWTGGFASDPVAAGLQGLTAGLTGHLLVAVGGAIALIAQYNMSAAWRMGAREGEQGELVQTGPFAVSRNLVFLGQLLLFAGLFLAFPDLVLLTTAATMFLAVSIQVRIEERIFSKTFGDAYADYVARVPRWIGSRLTSSAKDG
jgi:protein-S-isoprenylcysteine O-methyltransferase Ste14